MFIAPLYTRNKRQAVLSDPGVINLKVIKGQYTVYDHSDVQYTRNKDCKINSGSLSLKQLSDLLCMFSAQLPTSLFNPSHANLVAMPLTNLATAN